MRIPQRKADLETLVDEELMRLVGKGYEAAFTLLYQRYAPRLYGFLLKMLEHDAERARDLLHDIFLSVMEHPGKFDTGKKFSTWIYTVAANRCRNELRNQGTRRDILLALAKTGDTQVSMRYAAHDMQQFREQLQAYLDAMEEETRILFLLRFRQELSIKEIAAIMGLAEGTVKSRLFYLVRSLAEKLRVYHPYK
jgi:RNA polymerase sigma-70 factor (ECF subfamily)